MFKVASCSCVYESRTVVERLNSSLDFCEIYVLVLLAVANMVLAEKNNENARNGRRSRGPSPNGHVQAESTSEDESTGELLKLFP